MSMVLFSESHSESDKVFHLLEHFLFYSCSFLYLLSDGCYVKAEKQARDEASQITPIVQIHVCKDLFFFLTVVISERQI